MPVDEKKVWNIVVGGLRDTVNAHGVIDSDLIGSAAKRITPRLVELLNKLVDGGAPREVERCE